MSWFWKGDDGWVAYDDDQNAKLEAATAKGQKLCKLNADYSVNLTESYQYRNNDKSRQRAVKREEGKKKKGEPAGGPAKKQKTDDAPAPPVSGPGVKRLQRDLALLKKAEGADPEYTVEPEDDNLYIWNVKVYKFDQASNLAKQMAAYGKKHGQNYIHMRFHFPFDYPVNPPFVHVKSPKLMGGSIHQGGICTDILMNGKDGGWTPAITAEGLILQLRQLFTQANASIMNPNVQDTWSEAEARKGYNSVASIHSDWSKK